MKKYYEKEKFHYEKKYRSSQLKCNIISPVKLNSK